MKLKLNRKQLPFQFEVKNESGQSVVFDASEKVGGTGSGIRPMEGVASALAACASIDVLLILEKQKLKVEGFNVEIEASRVDDVPAIFDRILLVFQFQGDLPLSKLERAVELTMTKYCSVSKMLEKSCEINYKIELNQNR